MKHKKWLVWYYILNKRLLKKLSFLLILCSIPVIALLVGQMTGGEQGIIRVAAAPETGWEPVSQSMVQRLAAGGTIVKVTPCDSRAAAMELVRGGKADTAWLFADGLQEKLALAAAGMYQGILLLEKY